MIREIIVTSPHGVRLAFEATGEEGLEVQRCSPMATSVDICDRSRVIGPDGKQFAIIGMVPTSWLIELNETVT